MPLHLQFVRLLLLPLRGLEDGDPRIEVLNGLRRGLEVGDPRNEVLNGLLGVEGRSGGEVGGGGAAGAPPRAVAGPVEAL
jgi:hypothetical protein